jgi:hypothetical protein
LDTRLPDEGGDSSDAALDWSQAVRGVTEDSMNRLGKVAFVGLIPVLAAVALWLGAARARAQGAEWDVVRAEYGTRAGHVDVTDAVKRLLWDGRQSGRAPVSNQTMGGDPAPGADKSLHIWAHNWRNEEREFDIREGGWIDVASFRVQEFRAPEVHRDRDDDDCWCREGREDRWRGEHGLQVLRAYYGVAGRTANVTEIVRRSVHNGELRVHVDNGDMGGDPAPNGDQHALIVIFRYEGRESAISTKQGNTMKFP